MTDFASYMMEHVRLTVLRVLAQAPGYMANDSVLSQAVQTMGLPCTRDQLRHQLAWLAEQGLIVLEKATATLDVARITERGVDVAFGRATVPGVQRPAPGA